ncbi:hypothetical protein MCEKH45_01089 [Methylophilaceae bacterium]
MKSLLMLLFLIIVGCSIDDKSREDRVEIENIIKNTLNDPASVQFKDFRITKDNLYACITWNAKNKFGGYVDFKTTQFKWGKFTSESPVWSPIDADVVDNKCSQDSIDKYNNLLP